MAKPNTDRAGIIDTLSLSEQQWIRLAEQLDRADPQLVGQRKQPRVPYRKMAQIAVAVKRHDGEWGKYVVRSRDLSAGGIGFIHGVYIHIGSECRVILKDRQGKAICLEGVVRQCNYLSGTVHDVGVQFKEPINLDDFAIADAPIGSKA